MVPTIAFTLIATWFVCLFTGWTLGGLAPFAFIGGLLLLFSQFMRPVR